MLWQRRHLQHHPAGNVPTIIKPKTWAYLPDGRYHGRLRQSGVFNAIGAGLRKAGSSIKVVHPVSLLRRGFSTGEEINGLTVFPDIFLK